ncbi:sulfatase-like hydrolase/transferase [Parasalinivibrio latis]|uniref:sulfatase-like hydrolase/transferase n=1 Tax=Parasalinivibrio latis TaxID=2952610 RepID=UPI0030E1746A
MNKPNIILIITDTQSTNMISCYSHQRVNTNNIDSLASESIKFNSAYACAPICTPARAGIFTGIYSNQSGPWTNNIAPGKNIISMGRYFKDSGYKTCYIGKWHLDGHDYFGTGICPEEWDEDHWYDGANYLLDLSDEEIDLWRNGLNSIEDLERNNITSEFTWAHRSTDKAIRFLQDAEKEPEDPFLLVVSYDEPHHPFTCPPEYAGRYKNFGYDLGNKARDDLKNKPLHHRLWSEAMPTPVGEDGIYRHPLYFGCNDYVDDQVGRLISSLDNTTLANTWVVYTSDHGEMMGAHKLISKGAAMYDDITRIPLIIRPPVGLRQQREFDDPVSHIDILPTILNLAGIEKPPILPGRNILSAERENLENGGVMIEFNRYEIEHDSFGGFIPVRCWVDHDFKLVINLLTSDELYDRNGDPEEMNNLIDHPDYADIRDELHDRLLNYMDFIRDPFRSYEWAMRPWRENTNAAWMGAFRPRPSDGYAPCVCDYDTGKPTKGVKIEDKTLKY